MRFTIILLLSLFLGFPAASADRAELIQSMANFDKDYIPALALTNQGKELESVNSIRRLRTSWAQFKQMYMDGPVTTTDQWSKDMQAIEIKMTSAQNQINARELAEAHESLESIRYIFMDLRKRNDIQYYLDELTRFHEPMEEIVMIAQQADDMTSENLNLNILQHMEPLLASWQRIEKSRPPFDLFDIHSEQQVLIKKSIEDESKALERLQSALQHKGKHDIVQAASSIKPPFVRLYLAFGEFND